MLGAAANGWSSFLFFVFNNVVCPIIHMFEYAGVNFVGLEGESKEKLVVIGDGVDAVKLTNSLRKKVGQTDIISLAEVKAS